MKCTQMFEKCFATCTFFLSLLCTEIISLQLKPITCYLQCLQFHSIESIALHHREVVWSSSVYDFCPDFRKKNIKNVSKRISHVKNTVSTIQGLFVLHLAKDCIRDSFLSLLCFWRCRLNTKGFKTQGGAHCSHLYFTVNVNNHFQPS